MRNLPYASSGQYHCVVTFPGLSPPSTLTAPLVASPKMLHRCFSRTTPEPIPGTLIRRVTPAAFAHALYRGSVIVTPPHDPVQGRVTALYRRFRLGSFRQFR